MAEGVNQYKDITLTYYAPQGGTLTVKTDMPGGQLSLRRTITLPSTGTDRETYTFPLDDPSLLEGKLFAPKVTSNGVVILYEGFVRLRKVGEYIDGSMGEVWEPLPISF